jgi:chromosome segregation ATPase
MFVVVALQICWKLSSVCFRRARRTGRRCRQITTVLNQAVTTFTEQGNKRTELLEKLVNSMNGSGGSDKLAKLEGELSNVKQEVASLKSSVNNLESKLVQAMQSTLQQTLQQLLGRAPLAPLNDNAQLRAQVPPPPPGAPPGPPAAAPASKVAR